MSTPTEIMLLAGRRRRARRRRGGRAERAPWSRRSRACSRGWSARPAPTAARGWRNQRVRRRRTAAALVRTVRQRAADVVLDEAAHAAQLAQAVEVADERHVRVGRLVLGSVRSSKLLRRREQRRRRCGAGSPSSRGPAPRRRGRGGPGASRSTRGEEGLGSRRPPAAGRAPIVSRPNSAWICSRRAPDRRGRGDDLGPHAAVAVLACACTAPRSRSRRGRPWCRAGRRSGAARPG